MEVSELVTATAAATVATAAATTTVAAAAATAAGAFATTTVAATAAATAGALLTGACFVDGQGATLMGLAVKFLDGAGCVCSFRHGDEAETTRFAGHAVLHEENFLDGANGGEEVLEVGFGRLEREVTDV